MGESWVTNGTEFPVGPLSLGPCHVTGCENEAVGGEIGEGGDLLLCAEHLAASGRRPNDG